ncbi:MAG: DUF1573 domain-containing protein [Ignavibacteria bacterium]|nr:DUF1573 domain-containing protein [Ignavibacteria bacterium]
MNKFIALFVATILLTATVFAQPKIEIVGGNTYDWGSVKPPTSGHLEAKIQIKNIGTGVLNLIEIKPGCGCTKTDPDKTELKAGEISTMGVTLNIAATQSGPITKSITVRSNSATDSVLVIWLKADVNRAVRIEPSPYFAFNGAVSGQPITSTVFVTNADTKDLVISDFNVEPNMTLNVNKRTVIKAGEKLELVLSYTPTKAGPISGTITFKTSNEDNPDVTLSAWGNAAEAPTAVVPTAK